uniref:hypothetical protein n=1 Tax=Anaerococcus mediterraneensis TaxID=1870984 RepID=UPI00093172B7|nr:hypothetical protein [Anaerococcus mediterraneensis]
MKEMKNMILLSFLALILPFTSLASEGEKPTDNKDQKLGGKIIMTEDVKPDQSKTEGNKKDQNPDKNEEEKKSEPQKTEVKRDESDPKKVEEKSANNNVKTDKKDYDIKSIEKAVDDLVNKLDEDSDLTKALSEVKKTIKTDNKENPDRQTEIIIKDYSEKIEKAKTSSQKKSLENEAANKIKSITRDMTKVEKNQDLDTSSPTDDQDKEISSKKDKLVIEVKSDRDKDEIDRDKIYALAAEDDQEEENYLGSNPIIFIALIFLLAIVVAIGLAIRKRDKKDLD